MQASTARSVANAVVASVGVAAAVVIVTQPPLRRLTSRVLEYWLGASVPIFLARQVQRAWVESGSSASPGAGRLT